MSGIILPCPSFGGMDVDASCSGKNQFSIDTVILEMSRSPRGVLQLARIKKMPEKFSGIKDKAWWD
jgi:hypothetical protein